MTETADMTPLEAARVLSAARDYESDLRTRTNGLTWMIWGLVTPGLFLTYAFAAVAGVPPGWWWSVLWVPWVGAGILTSSALWRSAALTMPSLRTLGWRAFAVRFVLITAAYTALFFVAPIRGPEGGLLVVGLTWVAMSFLGYMRASRHGMLVALVAGGATAAVGLALLALKLPIEVGGTIAFFAAGAIPLSAGFYQTMRG